MPSVGHLRTPVEVIRIKLASEQGDGTVSNSSLKYLFSEAGREAMRADIERRVA